MSTALTIAAVIAVAIVALLLYASTKPDTFHVERSVLIQAAPEAIFPHINDLHQWDAWTPYNKDPAMKKTYSGSSAAGVGARYAWEGDKKVGQGEISIREAQPPHKLVFDLHMIKPFEGRNVAAFTLEPQSGNGNTTATTTRVTWSLDDKHKLLHKTMSIFLNLDNLIGKDFAQGLAQLKTLMETTTTTATTT
jgi:uncharacterized protein YndB with AHSA1/START domain